MAVLYYVDFSGIDTEKLISAYTDKVDKERLSKLTRTLAPEAKVRSLLAGYLLQVGLREDLGCGNRNKVIPLHYVYGENGKPYLAEYPDIYFGLSHSGTVVVCLIAGQEVGVDIQKYVKIKENLAKRFFTKEENAFLEKIKVKQGIESKEYEEAFFRFWSIKESYIKYTGRGMKQGLNTFDIHMDKGIIRDKEGTNSACFCEIQMQDLEEYACCVCMKESEDVRIVKMTVTESGEGTDEQISDS